MGCAIGLVHLFCDNAVRMPPPSEGSDASEADPRHSAQLCWSGRVRVSFRSLGPLGSSEKQSLHGGSLGGFGDGKWNIQRKKGM